MPTRGLRAPARTVLDVVATMRRDYVLDAFALMVAVGIFHLTVLQGSVSAGVSNAVFTVAVTAYFLTLVTRNVLTAARTPDRRAALLLLTAGLCLWAVGSATLTAQGVSEIAFPAPGEWFFLASYGGIAAFLLMEVPRRGAPTRTVWLEAAVVCAATACLSALLAIPVGRALESGPVAVNTHVVLAVLYPLIDGVLVVLVVGQVLLGQRAWGARTAVLAGGLVLLGAADSSFLLTLSEGTYESAPGLKLAYGLSFALVVGAALVRPPEVQTARTENNRSRVLIAAAAVAMAALVLRPGDNALGAAVTLAGVSTLAAAGWRLVLALREARGAAEALRLSRTDELTGLPNRRAVLQDLERARPDGAPLSLLLLDLDGFKDINDSMGHAVGDRVLVQLADRLRSRLGHQLSISRLGGDEFALVARNDDPLEMTAIGRNVCAVLAEPIIVDGLELTISASVGIAIRGGSVVAASDLLRRADVAMYEAKANRTGAVLYEAAHDNYTRARLRRNEELRRAIREGELSMWYQPQIDAATQQVVAIEALVRWQHPTEGLLTPAAFLPEARRHGLMPALSVDVSQQVVGQARQWLDEGFNFRVALNCAPPEILGGPVLAWLYQAMSAARLPAHTLLIEVTEDSFLHDPDRARELLFELQDMGVQTAIDDYGTGFSSLSYLRDLPVRELKMDRSFISTMLSDTGSRVIVDTTTKMAHALGLRLVAEGVEDAATAAALVAMDVDLLQGYHFAPPMPAASVGPWVRQWSAASSPAALLLPRAGDTY